MIQAIHLTPLKSPVPKEPSFHMFSLALAECSGSSSVLCPLCVLIIDYYSRRWAELTIFSWSSKWLWQSSRAEVTTSRACRVTAGNVNAWGGLMVTVVPGGQQSKHRDSTHVRPTAALDEGTTGVATFLVFPLLENKNWIFTWHFQFYVMF